MYEMVVPGSLQTCKGAGTSARAPNSFPLQGTADLLVPYTEKTKSRRTFYWGRETEAESMHMIYHESQVFC